MSSDVLKKCDNCGEQVLDVYLEDGLCSNCRDEDNTE
ncbi:hypothetical protein SAMN05421858_0089 [Haladaptatus litoreus]|uniref:Uncharacterized protein n=1 Tax=Haladaptatus litoreus TaxID=553468 RepID=A0A1N6UTB5_9EURY|nr:hypothetical protein SAMN05421858_0089 [Haladaptatus litoreus]